MTSKTRSLGLLGITVAAVLLLAGIGQAQKIRYSTFRLPGATFTEAIGVNNAGDVVGFYNDKEEIYSQGFLYSGGIVTSINDPRGMKGGTVPFAINAAGQVVGYYYTDAIQTYSFLYVNGSFSDIQLPATVVASTALGINNLGQIVGMYNDGKTWHGYFFDSVTLAFQSIDAPNASYTWGSGINDSGEMTLFSIDRSRNVQQAWLYDGEHITNIDVPGYDSTVSEGINNQGVVTLIATKGIFNYGFVYKKGHFTAVNPPGATSVALRGINDQGEVVGNYNLANGNLGSFLAMLPQQ
jgi:probable HAF family extracellular repeat protein